MTTTTTSARNGTPTGIATDDPIGPARDARVRHPMRVAVGAVLVVLCALVFALVLARVDQRSPVLVFSHEVQPGQRITAADLGQADVAASGIASIPPSRRGSVIGQVASGRFPSGAVVAAGELVSPGLADPNVVQLPMTLKAGTFPNGLAAGQAVLVVPTPGDVSSGSGSTTATTPVSGQVVSVQTQNSLGSGTTATVTVAVPKQDLPTLAAASAAGQIVLAAAGGGA